MHAIFSYTIILYALICGVILMLSSIERIIILMIRFCIFWMVKKLWHFMSKKYKPSFYCVSFIECHNHLQKPKQCFKQCDNCVNIIIEYHRIKNKCAGKKKK